jgi:hypothetical protein
MLQMIETFINRFDFLNKDYLDKLSLELKNKLDNDYNVSEYASTRRNTIEKQKKSIIL